MKKIFRQATMALLISSLLAVSTNIGSVIYGSSQSLFFSPASGTVSDGISVKDSADGVDDAYDRDSGSVQVLSPADGKRKTYILRETDGKIGVYASGADTPVFVLDVYVFTLPEKTAEMLRDGIECDDEGLSMLIDSFTS